MVGEPVPVKGEVTPEDAARYGQERLDVGGVGEGDGGVSDVPSFEDFAPSPRKEKSPLSRFPGKRSLRPALVCFALFFAASAHSWYVAPDEGLWVSRRAVLEHGEWWRLFTALFTHSDLGHLLSNAPLFLIFGWFLRAFFGFGVFPLTALVVGALSNLGTVWLYEPDQQLVGASGMLYGMVALWLVLYVRFETDHTVPMRIFRAIGVSLLMLFPTTFHEQTSYLAHAWGFLIGLVAGFAVAPFVHVRDPADAPEGEAPTDEIVPPGATLH